MIQWALKMTYSSFNLGSLPGMTAATLRVSMVRTLAGRLPRIRMPRGMGLKSRLSEAARRSSTFRPASARSCWPASRVTHPWMASEFSPGASFTKGTSRAQELRTTSSRNRRSGWCG